MRHLVIIESPFAGDVEGNTSYARAAVADSLSRGEAPLASHLLYTQPGILDDDEPSERRVGLAAGMAWYAAHSAETPVRCVAYVDRGVSDGMLLGIRAAVLAGAEVVFRTLFESDEAAESKAEAVALVARAFGQATIDVAGRKIKIYNPRAMAAIGRLPRG